MACATLAFTMYHTLKLLSTRIFAQGVSRAAPFLHF